MYPEPPPPMTAVTDAAIELFASLLPLQDSQSLLKVITQLMESVRSPKLERNAGRKEAVLVNATIAILLALRAATSSNAKQPRDTFGNNQVASMLADFLQVSYAS